MVKPGRHRDRGGEESGDEHEGRKAESCSAGLRALTLTIMPVVEAMLICARAGAGGRATSFEAPEIGAGGRGGGGSGSSRTWPFAKMQSVQCSTNAVRGTESKSAAAGLRVDHERRSRDLARKLRAREAMSGADSHRLADAGAIWRFNPQAFMWDFRCLAIEQLMADRYGPSTASLINLLLKTVRLKSLQVQPL
eukprot:2189760-Rhodomonas_salina.3